MVGKRSWALDSQMWRGGPPPPSWLDVFPRTEKARRENFLLISLTPPRQGGGSLAFEKWVNITKTHGLAVMRVQSKVAGERSRLPSSKQGSGWGHRMAIMQALGESACWLESALRGPPCSCAHCPDHLLSVFQTQGCIEYSKQNQTTGIPPGQRWREARQRQDLARGHIVTR